MLRRANERDLDSGENEEEEGHEEENSEESAFKNERMASNGTAGAVRRVIVIDGVRTVNRVVCVTISGAWIWIPSSCEEFCRNVISGRSSVDSISFESP
jgi:hypothetical protein